MTLASYFPAGPLGTCDEMEYIFEHNLYIGDVKVSPKDRCSEIYTIEIYIYISVPNCLSPIQEQLTAT